MIEVENLTKRYPGRTAIRDLTFNIGRGDIVGFLGPNGAGKSTTMRILSCFMPATSGTARVAGFDVFTQPDEVRRRIGYMPENNPLHLDMRVREYLKFRARLKGLGGGPSRHRVDAVLEQCGLTEVGKRIIGQLSKGFRQRVGLADSLVHEPELVILDEPTIGLDPNQIRAVRKLIKDLGKSHTVIISTHILSEVEMTCNRVIILNQGQILAADTTEKVRTRLSGGAVFAELAAPERELRETFAALPDLLHFDVAPSDGDYFRCTLTPRESHDMRGMIYELARTRNWPLRELTRNLHSLEDVFVHVTKPGKTGTDEEEEA